MRNFDGKKNQYFNLSLSKESKKKAAQKTTQEKIIMYNSYTSLKKTLDNILADLDTKFNIEEEKITDFSLILYELLNLSIEKRENYLLEKKIELTYFVENNNLCLSIKFEGFEKKLSDYINIINNLEFSMTKILSKEFSWDINNNTIMVILDL